MRKVNYGVVTVKTTPVSVRLRPEVKAALERAAADDSRSLSSYIEKVIMDRLRSDGFLKGAKR